MKLLTENIKGKKLPLIIVCATAFVLLILMIIGTFFDYEIAHVITAPYRGLAYYAFGMGFEVLGFLPAILVNVSLFAVLSVYSVKKGWKIAHHIFTAMTLAGAVFCAVFWTLDNHGYGVHRAVVGSVVTLAGIGLSFPVIIFFKRFDREKQKKIIYVLVIAAVLGSLANMMSGIMQPLWGRYRFYQIGYEYIRCSYTGDYIRINRPYMPWYRPMGRDGTAESRHGNYSFPSMHATSAASAVALILVAWVLNVKKSTFIVFTITAFALFFLVPLSRMVLGWHFLTDVVFSMILGLVAFICAVLIIDKGFGKKFRRFLNEENSGHTNNDVNAEKIDEETV